MQAGQQITGNLRLVRQLGQGGMGSVWIADHLALGTQVAVKFMSRTFAEHPQFIERFRREASAAAQLKNPHVAQVFDHGVTPDGSPFIVMELLEGEDLGKRVKREGPLPLQLVAEILAQTAKALGKAHQLGIVHRDIKADNLFLTDLDGEMFVKVLDFGIAKVRSDSAVSMTATGGTIGTPLYMSPEQLLSAKHVDHRADIWSLGVVAYYALTQRVPFPGDTIGAISVAVHTGVFQPPSGVQPGVPVEVDHWFQRVFRRNPEERFSSVKEMADAFRLAVHAPAAPLGPSPTPSPQPPDSSDNQKTLPIRASAPGVADTSPRTLDGKAVTIGSGTGHRAPRVLAAIAGVLALGVVVTVGVMRPWKGTTSGTSATPPDGPASNAVEPTPDTPPEASASPSKEPAPVVTVPPPDPTATTSVSGAPGTTTRTVSPAPKKPIAAPTSSTLARPTSSPSVPPKPPSPRPKPTSSTGDGDPGF